MLTLPEIRTVLMRVAFPATPEEMIRTATVEQAPDELLARLRTLPQHRYGSLDAVIDALRGQA